MSAALSPGVALLVADLQRMVGLLDAVLFRELWRAVAVATTRTLFNDVVTECFFSQQVLAMLAELALCIYLWGFGVLGSCLNEAGLSASGSLCLQ